MNTYQLTRQNVYDRAKERGYTLDQVEGCFIRDLGNGYWLVDVDHPTYPKPREGWTGGKAPCGGPGTELKKILRRWLGIVATPDCLCNAYALEMDNWGPDGCERHMDTILGWLRGQASERGMPFIDGFAARLVRWAIERVRIRQARST